MTSSVKLGETIYVIFRESINKVKVYMIGDLSFCHDETFNPYKLDEYRDELFYSEEGTRWFRTLKAAKEYILKDEDPNKVEVYRVETGYWELREKDT